MAAVTEDQTGVDEAQVEKDRIKAEKQAEKEAKAAEAKAAKEQKAAEAKAEKERKAAEREAAKVAKKTEQITKLATDNEIDVDSLTGTGDDGSVTLQDVRAAVKTKKAEERANKPKKAPLTLSQRRAVLKLADGALRPSTDMNRTPLDYLCGVGLAKVEELLVDVDVEVPNPKAGEEGEPKTVTETKSQSVKEYTLTDDGVARAKELNPKWKTWKPAAE